MSRIGVLAPALTLAFLLGTTPVAASPKLPSVETLSAPVITSTQAAQAAQLLDWIEVSGAGLATVTAAYVDQSPAIFELANQGKLRIQIPLGVNPGDAVIRLSGEFGLVSYHNLVQVLPTSKLLESKVTIGTFQGYAAVYTKNFKGKSLTIAIGNRQRVIPNLSSDYTQNLTQVGVGKRVLVKVFLDQELIQVRELIIQ